MAQEPVTETTPETRTRYGRLVKKPQRYEPIEQVEDDYATDEYDSSDSDGDDIPSEYTESDDDSEDDDSEGSLADFIVDDNDSEESSGDDEE